MNQVKIECLNECGNPTGVVHILSVPEAASKIQAFGLEVCDFPDALSCPYEIAHPWRVGLLDCGELVGMLAGTYENVKALQLVGQEEARWPSVVETMLIDAYAPVTLPGEIEYWEQKGHVAEAV